jgi:hypothetical protein
MTQVILLAFAFQDPPVWKLLLRPDPEFARQCLGWMRMAKRISGDNIRGASVEVRTWENWSEHVRVLAVEPGASGLAEQFEDEQECLLEPLVLDEDDLPEWIEDVSDPDEQQVSFVVDDGGLRVRYSVFERNGGGEFTGTWVSKAQLKRIAKRLPLESTYKPMPEDHHAEIADRDQVAKPSRPDGLSIQQIAWNLRGLTNEPIENLRIDGVKPIQSQNFAGVCSVIPRRDCAGYAACCPPEFIASNPSTGIPSKKPCAS